MIQAVGVGIFVTYGIVFGIGLNSIDIIALTRTVRWFSKPRGYMNGIVKVGTGAGQFALPFLLSILITAYGWRVSYITIGAGLLALLLLLGTMLSAYPRSSSPIIDQNSESVNGAFSSQRCLELATMVGYLVLLSLPEPLVER